MSMETITKELQSDDSQITAEGILNQLLTKENKEFKTEINNPIAVSAGDMIIDFIKDEFGETPSKILKNFFDWYRINYISYKRKSRTEVIEGLKAQNSQQVEQKGALLERLFTR